MGPPRARCCTTCRRLRTVAPTRPRLWPPRTRLCPRGSPSPSPSMARVRPRSAAHRSTRRRRPPHWRTRRRRRPVQSPHAPRWARARRLRLACGAAVAPWRTRSPGSSRALSRRSSRARDPPRRPATREPVEARSAVAV
eukprot:3790475-Prymnesium_polylepis.1